MKRLCPFCVKEIERFEEVRSDDGQTVYRCPHCPREAIAPAYVADEAARPVLVSLIGLKSHGKTVYLSSLLHALYTPSARWGHDYACSPVDTAGMVSLEGKLKDLRQGRLPASTQAAFTRPVIHRLSGVPWANDCWLLMYDTGGETFLDSRNFQEYAGYAVRSPVVMSLLSLDDLDTPEEPQKILVSHLDVLAQRGISPKERALLVVLTKGDVIRSWEGLPPVVARYLDGEEDPLEAGGFARLEEISDALQGWLEDGPPGLGLFVRQARRALGVVKYCVVSALGAEPEARKRLHISAVPRGVLVPLYWLWGLQEAPPVLLNRTRYCSLEWAMARAREGDTITLQAGKYVLPAGVHLQHGLRLVGAGVKDTKVVCPGPDHLLLYDGEGTFRAERIHFLHTGEASAHVCYARRGTVELHGCAFSGAVLDRATRRGGVGLLLDGLVKATVNSCVFTDNDAYGVWTLGAAQADLTGNRCRKNVYAGIAYSGHATGTARENRCEQNRYGIYVFEHAAPRLEVNRCTENRASGIFYAGSSAGDAVGNDCQDNGEHGLHVGGSARPALHDNRCRGNRQYGLQVGPSALPVPGVNRLEGNRLGPLNDLRNK